MPRLTIGIDASRAISPHPTGTENYSVQVIRHLLPLGDNTHYRLYLPRLPGELPGRLGVPGLPPRRIEWRVIPFPRLWTHVRLSGEMLTHPPDVLFVPSHVLPVVRPKRSVVTIHDLGYLRFPEAHTWWQRLYLRLSTIWNARTADEVTVISHATADDLVREYGVSRRKIHVIYPGLDEVVHYVPPEERGPILARYSLVGVRYILCLGTVQPRKNLMRLLQAYSRLPQRGDVKLVLVGKRGWLAGPILREVERLGLGDDVIFTGYVPEGHKAELVSGAVALAFVSLYEGFGFPLLEAQACRVPVLASNTSSLPEIAGESALLVDPLDVGAIADGLARILEDEGLREELVERGLENIRRFSWDRTAREMFQVLTGAAP